MKKSFAIILSGLLVIGVAGTIMAGSGGKCGMKNASACATKGAATTQTTDATSIVPAANTTTPAVTAENGCGGCPGTEKAAMKDAGCCPSKVEGASAPNAEKAAVTAEAASPEGKCDMKAGSCQMKAEGASVTPAVEGTVKKAS